MTGLLHLGHSVGATQVSRRSFAGMGRPGAISGTVKVEGAPVARRVRCYHRPTGVLVGEVWSTSDGLYRFKDLEMGQRYQVVAMDYEMQYNAVIADNVEALVSEVAPLPALSVAPPDLPLVRSLSPTPNSDARTSATVTVPNEVKPGDALVLFGIRRGDITGPSGWNAAPPPPPPPPDGAFDQWTYAYWRIADGSEAGQVLTVSYSDASSNRLNASVAVIRHAEHPVMVTELDSQRAPTGPSAETPLAVSGIAEPGLLMVMFSWVYSITSGTGFVRDWTSGVLPQKPTELEADPDGQLRTMAFSMLTDQESVLVEYDTDFESSGDSRSSIWLQFTADTSGGV